MEDKDEYINSLLLGLFLMQGEIDRLNETLDLARKGELVYINNPQIEKLKALVSQRDESVTEQTRIILELKAENERLQKLTCFNCGEETLSPSGAEIYEKILVYKQTLQEIKAIAEHETKELTDSAINGGRYLEIIDLITKAEEE